MRCNEYHALSTTIKLKHEKLNTSFIQITVDCSCLLNS